MPDLIDRVFVDDLVDRLKAIPVSRTIDESTLSEAIDRIRRCDELVSIILEMATKVEGHAVWIIEAVRQNRAGR